VTKSNPTYLITEYTSTQMAVLTAIPTKPSLFSSTGYSYSTNSHAITSMTRKTKSWLHDHLLQLRRSFPPTISDMRIIRVIRFTYQDDYRRLLPVIYDYSCFD
jgi:hypothetical protein